MGETSMSRLKAFRLKQGEGESVWSLGGRFTVKVAEANADGRFSLVEALAFRSTEPPLHIHHREDEAWYILDGHMTFYVGDEVIEADAGSFVYAPSGLAHTFTVDIEPTRVLVSPHPRALSTSHWISASPRLPTSRPLASPFPLRMSSARSRSATESKSSVHRTAPTPSTASGPNPGTGPATPWS
jgi:mannose-6-phosphate isomerase-like protein (cupin superfamily)